MSEKTRRNPQLYLHFWMTEPEVYRRSVIQVEVEAAEPCCERSTAGGGGFIRWREVDSSKELWRKLYQRLDGLCRPRQVWTDNIASAERRRRGVGHGGR